MVQLKATFQSLEYPLLVLLLTRSQFRDSVLHTGSLETMKQGALAQGLDQNKAFLGHHLDALRGHGPEVSKRWWPVFFSLHFAR